MCESIRIGSSGLARPSRPCGATTWAAKCFLCGALRALQWIPDHGGRQWAVIALLDYGPDPIPFFTQAHRVPLGVNMAFRREAFDRAGLWSNGVGRKKGTLLGQEVREWMYRARGAGLRGSYAPSMTVRHVIPGDRLNKRYFRRWDYWNGVSRALLYRDAWIDMQAPESTDVDFSRVPHVWGVPRFFYGKAPRELRRLLVRAWRGDRVGELRCRAVAVVFRRCAPATVEGPQAAEARSAQAGASRATAREA